MRISNMNLYNAKIKYRYSQKELFSIYSTQKLCSPSKTLLSKNIFKEIRNSQSFRYLQQENFEQNQTIPRSSNWHFHSLRYLHQNEQITPESNWRCKNNVPDWYSSNAISTKSIGTFDNMGEFRIIDPISDLTPSFYTEESAKVLPIEKQSSPTDTDKNYIKLSAMDTVKAQSEPENLNNFNQANLKNTQLEINYTKDNQEKLLLDKDNDIVSSLANDFKNVSLDEIPLKECFNTQKIPASNKMPIHDNNNVLQNLNLPAPIPFFVPFNLNNDTNNNMQIRQTESHYNNYIFNPLMANNIKFNSNNQNIRNYNLTNQNIHFELPFKFSQTEQSAVIMPQIPLYVEMLPKAPTNSYNNQPSNVSPVNSLGTNNNDRLQQQQPAVVIPQIPLYVEMPPKAPTNTYNNQPSNVSPVNLLGTNNNDRLQFEINSLERYLANVPKNPENCHQNLYSSFHNASNIFHQLTPVFNYSTPNSLQHNYSNAKPLITTTKFIDSNLTPTTNNVQEQKLHKPYSTMSIVFNENHFKTKKALSETWFYLDPQNVWRGSFESLEMINWYRAGYFQDWLLVQRLCDTECTSIADLKIICSKNLPFAFSHLIPPQHIFSNENNEFANYQPVKSSPSIDLSTILSTETLNEDENLKIKLLIEQNKLLKDQLFLANQSNNSSCDYNSSIKPSNIPHKEEQQNANDFVEESRINNSSNKRFNDAIIKRENFTEYNRENEILKEQRSCLYSSKNNFTEKLLNNYHQNQNHQKSTSIFSNWEPDEFVNFNQRLQPKSPTTSDKDKLIDIFKQCKNDKCTVINKTGRIEYNLDKTSFISYAEQLKSRTMNKAKLENKSEQRNYTSLATPTSVTENTSLIEKIDKLTEKKEINIDYDGFWNFESFEKNVVLSNTPNTEMIKAAKAEFLDWCYDSLAFYADVVDVPEFVSFLECIESHDEIREYIELYLGNDRACKKFAKKYISRRSKWENQNFSSTFNEDRQNEVHKSLFNMIL